MFKKLQKLDYWIAVPYAILSMLGVVMVFSATQGTTTALSNFIKQAIFVAVGLFGAFSLYHFNLKILQRRKFLNQMLMVIIAALIVARFFMPAVNGAHGWINLGIVTLQPAEFLKLGLILYFAAFFAREPWQRHVTLREQPDSRYNLLLRILIWIWSWIPWFCRMLISIRKQPVARRDVWILPALSLGLVFIMPDNGNGLIILLILLAIFLASGVSRKAIAGFAALGGLFFGSLQTFARFFSQHVNGSQHYALARLTSFANPWDPSAADASRQLLYGYYAIAHGGVFGVGLGNSLIKPYLPESNTDFIMAVMTEELGAVTTAIVLILMLILITRMVILGIRQRSQYYRLLLFGIATLFFIQMLVNLGGVIGVLPITGVVFPFISGGGSSYIVYSAAIGLTLNIAATQQRSVSIHPADTLARKDYK